MAVSLDLLDGIGGLVVGRLAADEVVDAVRGLLFVPESASGRAEYYNEVSHEIQAQQNGEAREVESGALGGGQLAWFREKISVQLPRRTSRDGEEVTEERVGEPLVDACGVFRPTRVS